MAQTVLIAALSGRALAQSARRAGFQPLVVDAFGDIDLADAAAASRRIPSYFRAAAVLGALHDLAHDTQNSPVGLVLGAGFEDRPRLIRRLAAEFRLIGSTPAVIAIAKNPRFLAETLRQLDIAHPDIRFEPHPVDSGEWLSKRVGGTGGLHIRRALPTGLPRAPSRYFQRRTDGEPVSVLAAAGEDGASVIGVSRQWTNPAPATPYRYGGAVGPIELPDALIVSLTSATGRVASAFNLIGLFSLDFLIVGHRAVLLEINPRPGATLDIFDDETGRLFAAHLTSNLSEPAIRGTRSDVVRAAAYLYADRSPLTVGAISWPDWAADRPTPGSAIRRHAPIATVFGEGPDETAACACLSERLARLGEMLYGRLQK